MKSFHIGERVVGGDAPVLIVAELSANHGGKLETALATIEMAAKCGADAIKIQTYTPDTLTLRSKAEPFVVRTKNEWAGRTLHDLYAEAMTPWEWHKELSDCAKTHGLLLFSTPFDATALELLEDLAFPVHKIASFELVDLPLVERVARTGKPIIMSTGMATLGEVEAAVATCRSAGNEQIALLRCVSAYPAKAESMDLMSLATLSSFGVVIGLSDHSREPTAAIAAVALGAKILEKHFILHRDVGGPDAFFSLEPDELKQTVAAVRTAEAAIGRPRFGPTQEEVPSLAFRRSLFIARDVAAGQVLDADDVRSVRPSGGLPARHLPEVLGRVATRAATAGTALTWDVVGERPVERGITLRPATSSDSSLLLEWRNDADTRLMSLSTEIVTDPAHAAWLAASLSSKDRVIFIATDAESAIGQARLDSRGSGTWEMSITIAPSSRGRKLSARVLVAAEQEARKRGITRLEATIRPGNEASLRAFKRAGYYGFAEASRGGIKVVRCERRLLPY